MDSQHVAHTPCQANRVAAGHIPVLPAAAELVLPPVEAVHQVPGAGCGAVPTPWIWSFRAGHRLLTHASRWTDHENPPSRGAGVLFGTPLSA
jgi:hypothetical protein